MTPRERLKRAIRHQAADRIPVDVGGTVVTGIQPQSYANLKRDLGMPAGNIKVYDPFQVLAEVEEPVRQRLGVDTLSIESLKTVFGYKNENWKPFTLPDGTEVLMSGHFEYDVLENGDIVQYPQGNRNAPPSAIMPNDGYYFDSLIRQEPIDEDTLDPKAWAEQMYAVYTDEDLRHFEATAQQFYAHTDYALIGSFWGGNFGDIAQVPGLAVLHPTGIRDPKEWYMSLVTRKGYIQEIFQHTLDIALKNLELYHQAIGEKIDVVVISGADFGSQTSTVYAPRTYRELFKPFHKAMNDWVHQHTNWKTFYHTCGAITSLLDDFHEAGIDILNPVQVSAKGMDPQFLKTNYGNKFVFWGGAVNPQGTLPFGTPEQVYEEVTRNIEVFKPGGGFVFANVHNIQAGVPVENLMAMFDALHENWSY
ncbi:methyltransferase [candidate division KSB3 bacterium]|uniref:Methyltransferase n=1 Tax=candidate division KSB3 bacterium TaxID=2044937 RepID=A0A9D5Q6C7_9BACT|nr:methyltransferase [candidate division KSB3 bacterium]MBD3325709.1 methyltransferase [candidate division KSB3 bacterium]